MQPRLIRAFVLIVITLGCSFSPVRADPSPRAGEAIHVQGGPWLLAGRVYKSARLSPHPHLILVVHGDAPFTEPSYQYPFAGRAADALEDAVVAALLRPGYGDGQGLQSEGEIGWKLGDNYTRDRIDGIAAAARALVAQYQAADLTLAGHSGGAAIAANLLALYPRLASRAMLVSCPCEVPAFRWNMMRLQWNPLWLLPESSISPQDNVAAIPDAAVVRMVVGAEDPVTPKRLTLAFADALKARDGDVTVTVLQGLGHEIFLKPQVLDQLRQLMSATP